MTTRTPMTPRQAHPHALELLTALHHSIGDKNAIQAAITRTTEQHPHNWPLIVASALGHAYADHARPDPNPRSAA